MSSRDAIVILLLHYSFYFFFNKGNSHEIMMKLNQFLTLLSTLLMRYVVHDELKASQLPKTENHIHEIITFFSPFQDNSKKKT